MQEKLCEINEKSEPVIGGRVEALMGRYHSQQDWSELEFTVCKYCRYSYTDLIFHSLQEQHVTERYLPYYDVLNFV